MNRMMSFVLLAGSALLAACAGPAPMQGGEPEYTLVGIDDAVRRILQSQLPYQAFSPALAREFDVIEIRRTWYFDMAVRLY